MALTELAHGFGGGSVSLVATGVSSGADLVVALAQWGTATRTYTVSSNVGGAFTALATYNPRGYVGIFRLKAASAGSHTIDVVANSGSTNVWAWVFEATDADQSAAALVPAASGFTDAAATDNHASAASGEIVIPSAGVAVAVGVLEGSVSATSAGSGWTKATAASSISVFCQYRPVSASTDQGLWTSSGTDRIGAATMAVILDAAGGSSSTWGGPGWWVGL